MSRPSDRTVGLFGALVIGVGAIVGGGILALAGVAFSKAGPSALIAFSLNGVVALLTALSFAELSALFPHSGGTYAFAKRVLSVRTAFTVGWTVYFASIAAGVLYAVGFAEFAAIPLRELVLVVFGSLPTFLEGRTFTVALALAATALYAFGLSRSSGGGGSWATVGKVAVFAVIIVAGLNTLLGIPPAAVGRKLTPFFTGGAGGLVAAMGFTFIAFQGFDLIAAAAGEIKAPAKTIPRAMLLSLAIALAVYLPLLLVIATVGTPEGRSVAELGRTFPETVVAVASETFMGRAGFWLVVTAAILSMLSALQANLFAASRIAMAMARDRTLPRTLGRRNARGLPATAVLVSAGVLALILLVLADVATAGATASLIFLITFTLAHATGALARLRTGDRPLPFRTPLFPAVPLLGGVACAALAIFQGIVVPIAGIITLLWIALGIGIYLWLFAQDARAADALAEAQDPFLVQLRGRRPLVLAPINNPANTKAMVTVANALTPPGPGRVLLLNIVTGLKGEEKGALENSQAVLRSSLAASFDLGLYPEALTTVSETPWREIGRVAREHDCESLLLGLSDLEDDEIREQVNGLISRVRSDVVVLRVTPEWQLSDVGRVLIPIRGRSDQEVLRARLLGNLTRTATPEVTYLRVVPTSTTGASLARARRGLAQLTEDRNLGMARAEVVPSDDPLGEITRRAAEHDLMILGLRRYRRQRKMIGTFVKGIASETDPNCTMILISQRR
ncbi:MAG: amino acid permease [Truepera sp.]|nr:amino acid permease [Truepera sp.]